jgi:hypothetical protein
MKVACKSCSREIPAENINIDRLVAKCSYCNAVFSFADRMQRASQSRAAVSAPKGLSVSSEGHDLVIRRRWFSPVVFFLLLFTVLWDGFMVGWYYIALTKGILIMAVFGVVHAAVGLIFTYYTIASFFNTTTVRANRRELSVSHRPVYFPGVRLGVEEVEQLYCREKARGGGSTTGNYELRARTQTGADKVLVKRLDQVEPALFLEQQLESHLGITDRTVGERGEVT